MDRKLLFAIATLILMSGVGSADWSGYGLGDEYYGLTYHYDSQESVLPTGGYLPYEPSYIKVIDDSILYSINLTGAGELFCAYNFTANTTNWCADVVTYDGVSSYFPFIMEDVGTVLLAGTNEVMIDDAGTIYYNETSPDYYYWMSLTPYATKYYNNNTRMGLFFKDENIALYKYYWMDVQLKYYNQSGNKILQPNNYLGYYTAGYRGYEYISDVPQYYAGMNKPIYDKTNNYIIQVTERSYQSLKNNQTYVLSDPNIIPLNFNKGCWIDSSCGTNGTGYYVKCSIAGGQNITPYSCDNDGQCTGSSNTYCRFVESEGENKCVNSDTGGVCQMGLRSPCIISIPTTQFQHAFTYDYLTKMLYLYVRDGSNMIIYNQDVSQCEFDGNTNLTASLFGYYGQEVVSAEEGYLSQSPIMDNNYIYVVWNNATGYYFQKIDRNTKALVYSRALTKDIYNSSMTGNINGLNTGYMGYDTSTKDVYVFVDTNKFVKFGQINYTTCPNEDPHIADPMCFTNGTLDLINHQWCDTSVAPTENQPCIDKIIVGYNCTRDWQCQDNPAEQGWCDIDSATGYGHPVCEYVDSPLNYNCTTGMLSWNTPTDISYWITMITNGSEYSLFNSRSVEEHEVGYTWNITQTSLQINLSSNSYYRGVVFDIYGREYWKTDIIKGSDVLPITTTSTTTTTTTISTTTTTSTSSTTTTTISSIYSGYNLLVDTCYNIYDLNDSLGCYRAYFSRNHVYIEGASCIAKVDDNVFSHGLFSNMIYYSGTSPPYYSEETTVRVKDNQSAKDTMVNVTCTNNSISITNWTMVHINGNVYGGNPVLEFPTPLTDGLINTYHEIIARLRFDDGTLIANASCRLYVDSQFESELVEQSNHLYQTGYIYSIWTGLYDYKVYCNRSDIGFVNRSGFFNIYQFVNQTSTTLPPQQCNIVGRIRYDITGCGGHTYTVDRKRCKSDHILEITHTTIDCIPSNYLCDSDNIGRTEQLGGDVEQSCNAPSATTTTTLTHQVCTLTPPDCDYSLIGCHCSDSYIPCNNHGTCLCNQTIGMCYITPCVDDAQCNFTKIIKVGGVSTEKHFKCIEGYCGFSEFSSAPNASNTPTVYPLSGIIYQENGYNLYLSICEDNTNGFRVTTDAVTHTQYQLQTMYYGSPVLPSMSNWKSFGSVDKKDKSYIVPELCAWNGDYRYGRIEIKCEANGVNPESKNIDVLVLKKKFVVNATKSSSGSYNAHITLNRNGTCFIKQSIGDEYTTTGQGVNNSFEVNYTEILGNFTSSNMYWMCNSTFNEQKSGSVYRSGFGLTLNFLSFLWGYVFGWFEWKPWYILIVVFVVMIILPLVILLMRGGVRGD